MYSALLTAQVVKPFPADTTGISAVNIKDLSIEELMNIEVTSVSKRPERLADAAAAIQVITQEDIRRSGVTSLPEALRLAPNLQVAQYNSYAWIISARGFNNVFSNKLLVLIDGRTVYSPLFAGVYWDVQSVLLEDIDRIEVVSGPGGTLWGANAVNGVINIITKKAKDTQGVYLSAARGDQLRSQLSARYGGQISPSVNYKVFLMRNDRNETLDAAGQNNADNWDLNQGGIRVDYDAGGADRLSFQANVMGGTEHTNPGPSSFDHQDAMVKWSHAFSNRSDMQAHVYYDRMWRRDLPNAFNDQLETYDVDLQHHFQFAKTNTLIWGIGYRLMKDNSQSNTELFGFIPARRGLHLYSGFIQDEIGLAKNQLKLILGTKLLHNDYTGFEIQPSARLAWTPDAQQTIWAAVTRAVRTPSRLDVDYHLPTYSVEPGVPNVAGGPNFVSEKLHAYEIGYRLQPSQKLSLSLATFYNHYNDLYSVEPIPGTLTYLIQNGMKGNSEGVELSGIYQVLKPLRIRGGYTFFHKDITDKPGHSFDRTYHGTDPQHQIVLQSMVDLPFNLKLDVAGRYISSRPVSVVAKLPRVPGYVNMSFRLAWVYRHLELSFAGQNILDRSHVEFGSMGIPRNLYGKIAFRF